MMIDITGLELVPGNNGNDCPGNGEYFDKNGNIIECCCDECDYLQCCCVSNPPCNDCNDRNCPNHRS